MRKRFEIQYELGAVPIKDLDFSASKRSRDEMPAVLRGLHHVYTKPDLNEKIFDILEKRICGGKKKTGRPGMSLWEILVLGVVRLARDMNYDELEYAANYDMLVRGVLGVHVYGSDNPKTYVMQTIKDNVNLIDRELLGELNRVIVESGHELLGCKKKDLLVKTDSYVLESNVHFPTDVNLLWDAGRKCFDLVEKIGSDEGFVSGWRKQKQWRRRLKGSFLRVTRSRHGGGKNKSWRVEEATLEYLDLAAELSKKLKKSKALIVRYAVARGIQGLSELIELKYFEEMLDKHRDLVYRRVIKSEKIPHHEKMFSLFETYTQWINKGKSGSRVELGMPLVIATDQHGFVLEYEMLSEGGGDVGIAIEMGERINRWNRVKSMSFDKGFWSQENWDRLSGMVEELILPKKGRLRLAEKERESTKTFKKLRSKHAGIESDINMLEHHGANRCPDRGYKHFEVYAGLGILSMNLHRLGNLLKARQRKYEKGKQRLLAVA